MTFRIVALTAVALCCAIIDAKADDYVLSCTPEKSQFRIAIAGDRSQQPFAHQQSIRLPETGWIPNPAFPGDGRRTAGKPVAYACGQFSFRINTGFFNANPQGELGAADDFAVIVVSAGGHSREFQMSSYECPELGGRSQYMLPNNVDRIVGRPSANGFELKLTRSVCNANYESHAVEEVVRL